MTRLHFTIHTTYFIHSSKGDQKGVKYCCRSPNIIVCYLVSILSPKHLLCVILLILFQKSVWPTSVMYILNLNSIGVYRKWKKICTLYKKESTKKKLHGFLKLNCLRQIYHYLPFVFLHTI